jgi:hypothetical protein
MQVLQGQSSRGCVRGKVEGTAVTGALRIWVVFA